MARSLRNQPSSLQSPSWPNGVLRSPETRLPLSFDTPHSVTDGTTRWPVADGIPFLRAGREDVRGKALAALDAGNERLALVELLRDQDDWAPDPPPDCKGVEAILDRDPSLQRAMELLGFGPVADYFTYRLSDPTYLAGLALISTHWNAPKTSFELACGIGHYSRELSRRGVETAAGDVVFAKLWLARRYVTPESRLVCFDAAAPFPLSNGAADLALCNDALYFLPEKRHVAGELLRVAGEGTVIVGHTHNAAVENHSSGAPLTVEGYAELFPEPLLYDDADATEAFFGGEALKPREADELFGSEAICLVAGDVGSGPASGSASDLTLPPPGTLLVTNPLYEAGGRDPVFLRLRWPSEKYEAEYAPRSGYLPEKTSVPRDVLDQAAAGNIDEEVERLARQRVLLDLPGEW